LAQDVVLVARATIHDMRKLLIAALCCAPRFLHGLCASNGDPRVVEEADDPFMSFTDDDLSSNRLKFAPPPDLTNASNVSLQPMKGPSEGTASNIVLFMTTHLSINHISFLECWPSKILTHSQSLASADIIVQTFGNVTPSVKSALLAFPNKIVRLADLGENPGKQQGAMKGIAEAFRNGWLTSYEWVIRLNPDVVIWSDTRLMAAMKPSKTWGVFGHCHMGLKPWQLAKNRINTDMFAIRPNRVSSVAFSDWWTHKKAEDQAAHEFKVIRKGNHELILPNSKCRFHGGGIWHEEASCDDVFNRKPWLASPPQQ